MAQVIGIGPDTKRDDTVYDPTCGSGSLLIKAADEAPNGLTIYGQEKDVATWTMACMNMILHGRVAAEIKRDNTLAAPRFTDGPGRLKSTPPSPWVALDFAGSQVQGARTMRMRPWKRVRSYMTMVTLAATGCAGDSSDSLDWPGTVEADVDDLTGERTGLFRTYGPTAIIVAGRDTVPVTVGYWCQVQGAEYQPLTAVDGMFLKVSLADTSLISSGTEAFVELRGTLGLLDLARMAVDGHVSPWRYDPMPELGAWYLDGAMGYVPDEELDTSVEREALVSALRVGYDLAGDLVETNASSRMSNSVLQDTDQAVSELRLKWAPATDYVASHYFGRNTLGVELKGVVKFSLRGFSAAADSVRFWCPVPQSHHEWNAARVAFFGRIDSGLCT